MALRWRGAVAIGAMAVFWAWGVGAARAQEASFCVIHDARRPDLREAWFAVMAAVRTAEMRVRLKVLTWQELAAALPAELRAFLEIKYGI